MRLGSLVMIALIGAIIPLGSGAASERFLDCRTSQSDRINTAIDARERGDYGTHRQIFLSLAEDGWPDAQAILGRLYYIGMGVPQNYQAAHEWFKRAAAQGDGDALKTLGDMHAFSEGVPENFAISYMWYSLAASTNDHISAKAASLRDYLVTKRLLSSAELSKAQYATEEMWKEIDARRQLIDDCYANIRKANQ